MAKGLNGSQKKIVNKFAHMLQLTLTQITLNMTLICRCYNLDFIRHR